MCNPVCHVLKGPLLPHLLEKEGIYDILWPCVHFEAAKKPSSWQKQVLYKNYPGVWEMDTTGQTYSQSEKHKTCPIFNKWLSQQDFDSVNEFCLSKLVDTFILWPVPGFFLAIFKDNDWCNRISAVRTWLWWDSRHISLKLINIVKPQSQDKYDPVLYLKCEDRTQDL